MDLAIINNTFFQTRSYTKKSGFDSYSQSSEDIIYHYINKYTELDSRYKKNIQLSIELLNTIRQSVKKLSVDEVCIKYNIDTPLELYTLAFISSFEGENLNAIEYFNKTISYLTDKSISSSINKIFILLQIALLYQIETKYRESLGYLLYTYKEINQNKELMDVINNFFASCCISIGLLYNNIFNNKTIAGMCFYRSIQTRLKFKERYEIPIFNNYISNAYKYAALTYFSKKADKYFFLKEAYKIRFNLLKSFEDNYTKEEFVYISSDYLIFLIQHSYKIGLVNRVSNTLYKNISVLSFKSQNNIFDDIIKISNVLSKYYYLNSMTHLFFKWYSLSRYFKIKFKSDFEISFFKSEELYNSIK